MKEDRDLRLYVDMLVRNWRWIVVGTLLGGAVALVLSIVGPAKFEAAATVLITNPLGEFRLSPESQISTGGQPPLAGKAAVELATNDGLLQQVLAAVASELPDDQRNLYSLRKMLGARTGADTAVIRLGVTATDGKRAAFIANTWSNLYVQQVNDLYGKSPDQSSFYSDQLAEAEDDLKKADQALIDYEMGSELAVLQAQLSAKQSALSRYLEMNETLVLLQQNAKALQDQLARRPANTPSSLGDDLAQLLLQVSVFSAQSTNLPVQLQLPSTDILSNARADQQAAYLADLSKTIESRRVEVKNQTDALLPEIKALQGRIQETSTEGTRLTRERDLAQNIYAALALKARESSITAQSGSGSVRLVSSAATPDRPASRRLLTNTFLGLMLGFVTSVTAVFSIEYLRGPVTAAMELRPRYDPVGEGVEN